VEREHRGKTSKPSLTKKVKYHAQCRLKDKKTDFVLSYILLSREFMYEIYSNTVYLVVFSNRKYYSFPP
jgi:hypothetical protein